MGKPREALVQQKIMKMECARETVKGWTNRASLKNSMFKITAVFTYLKKHTVKMIRLAAECLVTWLFYVELAQFASKTTDLENRLVFVFYINLL